MWSDRLMVCTQKQHVTKFSIDLNLQKYLILFSIDFIQTKPQVGEALEKKWTHELKLMICFQLYKFKTLYIARQHKNPKVK